MTHQTTRRRLLGSLAALAVVVAACGSDADDAVGSQTTDEASDTTTATATTDPVTTDGDGTGTVERVVSLSPTHTEMMFAIGAGDLLVAVDEFSNYPQAALDLPNELSGYEPNVEAIAGYEPDLVLIGGDFSGLGDQLAAVGIESWDGPAGMTLDDTYAQIADLGVLTGHIDEAAALVASMRADIDEIVANAPEMPEALTYFHELSPDLYSADSTTYIGQLYALLGLENIADEAGAQAGGWPQLNAEFIVSADPDLIFLADTVCCGENLETVSARPGWEAMSAVVNGNVVELNDDVASRWGPRVVDLLAAMSAAVEAALVAA